MAMKGGTASNDCQMVRHKDTSCAGSPQLILEQDQAGELVFFDQQPFVVTESFALAADQKQLADFLPQCLHGHAPSYNLDKLPANV